MEEVNIKQTQLSTKLKFKMAMKLSLAKKSLARLENWKPIFNKLLKFKVHSLATDIHLLNHHSCKIGLTH